MSSSVAIVDHQVFAVAGGLATALANAFAVTTQHVASQRSAQRHRGWRVVDDLLRQPLWLLGWLALLGSLVCQAVALHFGPMAEVQPLLISELVFALVLRRWWLAQRVRGVTWAAAAASVVGLTIFVTAATPQGGASTNAASTWPPVLVTGALVIGALVVIGRSSAPPRRRAGAWGAATAIAWAFEAVFIKRTTDAMTAHGYLGVLAHWPIYAFVVCGVLGLVCEQMALHVGPLSVSQPFIVIVDPIVSVGLGVGLFAERWPSSLPSVVLAAVGFVAACVAAGVMITTSSAETMVFDHL